MDFINSMFVVAVMLTSLMLGDILVASMYALLDFYQAGHFGRRAVAAISPSAEVRAPRPLQDFLKREREPRRAPPVTMPVVRAPAPWNRSHPAVVA